MPTLLDALIRFPDVRVFRQVGGSAGDPPSWELDPVDAPVLAGDEHEHFVIAALHVLPDKTVRKCFMNMSLPERIADYAFFVEDGELVQGYKLDFPGQILP